MRCEPSVRELVVETEAAGGLILDGLALTQRFAGAGNAGMLSTYEANMTMHHSDGFCRRRSSFDDGYQNLAKIVRTTVRR